MTFAPRTWVVGETVTAAIMNQEIRDQVNSLLAAWTAYTPTWTTTGTAPAIVNGALTGRYMKMGRTVWGHINWTMGSTTNVGTGNWSFALPAQAASNASNLVGSCQYLGADRWGGSCLISPGATTTSPFFSNAAGDSRLGLANSTEPETHVSGNVARITFTYETAS